MTRERVLCPDFAALTTNIARQDRGGPGVGARSVARREPISPDARCIIVNPTLELEGIMRITAHDGFCGAETSNVRIAHAPETARSQ